MSTPSLAADFVVDGVTIQNGSVIGNGGGLYLKTLGGNIRLNNNKIIDSSAKESSSGGGRGGGVFIDQYANLVELFNNTIAASSARESGGVSINDSKTITLNSNSISSIFSNCSTLF